MSKQIIIGEQHRIAAVFSEDRIQELIVASGNHQVGDVYLGIVENVLPSIDAAFINIGNPERNGFIHVSDLGPIRLKRSSSAITELVAPQQKVLVQVMKEPTGNKGPRLTGNLSFPGRYLVLMPSGRGVNLSSRIRDEEERNRLKSLAILIKPPQMGLMVRTEAEGVPEESIIEDLEILKKQWEAIQQEQHSTRAPNLLNRDNDFIQRVLRDAFSDRVNRIVTDTSEGVQRVRKHLQNWNKGRMPMGVVVDAHRESTPIFEFYRVNAAIRQALRPRVDLPSGGYIIIEPTEALTVIDVNSGSFTRSATSRETVLWTNCEAATEIAHQMRLRNIAGVIVVDFIDMDSRRDQLQVLEHFNKALRADKARPQIAQLSELGLVELTRKRQGQSLYEVFGRPCPTCEGLGILAHLPGAQPELEQTPFDRSISQASAVLASSVPDAPILGASTRVGGDRNGGSRRKTRYSNGGRSSTVVPENLYQGSKRRRRSSPASPTRNDSAAPPPPTKVIEPPAKNQRPVEKVEKVEKVEEPTPTSPTPAPTPRKVRRRIVNVEMTPLQQKVYSEMGISPLALLDEPIKVGRDTVVSVSLPGEGPPQVDDALAAVDDAVESLINDAADEPTAIDPSDKPCEDESNVVAVDVATDRLDDPLDDPLDDLPARESAEEVEETASSSPPLEQTAAAEIEPKKKSPAASRRRRSRPSS